MRKTLECLVFVSTITCAMYTLVTAIEDKIKIRLTMNRLIELQAKLENKEKVESN